MDSSAGRRMVIDDDGIIQRVLAGDADAYGDLVAKHQAQVYRLCLAILSDPQDAEDASQNTFIKGFRRLEGFRGQAAFGTWLTRIAINQCKDRLRQRRRRRAQSLDAILESGASLPAALVQGPSPSAPEMPLPPGLLERLSPDERGLLELVLGDDEPSYLELGRRLGMSVDSVKGRLKRARQKLRRLWPPKERA